MLFTLKSATASLISEETFTVNGFSYRAKNLNVDRRTSNIEF